MASDWGVITSGRWKGPALSGRTNGEGAPLRQAPFDGLGGASSPLLCVVMAVTGRRMPILGRIPVTTADFPRFVLSEFLEKDTLGFLVWPISRSSLVSYRRMAPSSSPSKRLRVLAGSLRGLTGEEQRVNGGYNETGIKYTYSACPSPSCVVPIQSVQRSLDPIHRSVFV